MKGPIAASQPTISSPGNIPSFSTHIDDGSTYDTLCRDAEHNLTSAHHHHQQQHQTPLMAQTVMQHDNAAMKDIGAAEMPLSRLQLSHHTPNNLTSVPRQHCGSSHPCPMNDNVCVVDHNFGVGATDKLIVSHRSHQTTTMPISIFRNESGDSQLYGIAENGSSNDLRPFDKSYLNNHEQDQSPLSDSTHSKSLQCTAALTSSIVCLTEVTMRGFVCSPRWGLSAATLNDKIYAFGGYLWFHGVDGFFNDLYVIDSVSSYMNRVSIQEGCLQPSPRFGHSLVADVKLCRLVLFGGRDGTTTFDDLWSFYPDTNEWKEEGKNCFDGGGNNDFGSCSGMIPNCDATLNRTTGASSSDENARVVSLSNECKNVDGTYTGFVSVGSQRHCVVDKVNGRSSRNNSSANAEERRLSPPQASQQHGRQSDISQLDYCYNIDACKAVNPTSLSMQRTCDVNDSERDFNNPDPAARVTSNSMVTPTSPKSTMYDTNQRYTGCAPVSAQTTASTTPSLLQRSSMSENHPKVSRDGNDYNFGVYREMPCESKFRSGEDGIVAVKGGSRPNARSWHTAVVYDGGMYVCGGWDYGNLTFCDVWRLDFVDMTWCELYNDSQGQVESVDEVKFYGRSCHCSAVWGKELYVFGGLSARAESPIADICAFSLETFKWRTVGDPTCCPGGRVSASSAVVGDSWIIHGGLTEYPKSGASAIKEVILFNFSTQYWHTCPLLLLEDGTSAAARYGHCAVLMPNTTSILFIGGAEKYATATKSRIARLDFLPCANFASSLVNSLQDINAKNAVAASQANAALTSQVFETAHAAKKDIFDLRDHHDNLQSQIVSLQSAVQTLQVQVSVLQQSISSFEQFVPMMRNFGAAIANFGTWHTVPSNASAPPNNPIPNSNLIPRQQLQGRHDLLQHQSLANNNSQPQPQTSASRSAVGQNS